MKKIDGVKNHRTEFERSINLMQNLKESTRKRVLNEIIGFGQNTKKSIPNLDKFVEIMANFETVQEKLLQYPGYSRNSNEDMVKMDRYSQLEYIPSNFVKVFLAFAYLREQGAPDFLRGIDLGSALGTICQIGSLFFKGFDGVEIDKVRYGIAAGDPYNRKNMKINLYYANLLDVDLSVYQIIYFYLGGRADFFSRLQKKIESEVVPGAFVVTPRKGVEKSCQHVLLVSSLKESNKLSYFDQIGDIDIFKRV